MPRVMLLGACGMLAGVLARRLAETPGITFFPYTAVALDITHAAAVDAALSSVKPDWVINAAAFLPVDACEENPEASHHVNAEAPTMLAALLADRYSDTRLIHFSSDFVFDGKIGGYDEMAPVNPLSIYGKHKAEADETILASGARAYVLRIASLIGAGEGTRDFIKNLVMRARTGGQKISINAEYEISLSTTSFVADVVARFIEVPPAPGLYHAVASGKTTWHALALRAFERLGISALIEAAPASAYPQLAARPRKSWMKNEKLTAAIGPIPDWRAMLEAQLEKSA